MQALLANLRWNSLRLWYSGTGCLVLLFLIAALALFSFLTQSRMIAHRKTTPTQAKITGIGYGGSKYRPGLIFISAQDPDGIVGGAAFDPRQVTGCKIGDTIKAERYGIALTLDPSPCHNANGSFQTP